MVTDLQHVDVSIAVVLDPEDRRKCDDVINRMAEHLSPAQSRILNDVLTQVFFDGASEVDNIGIIKKYLVAKSIEGCTERTIENYGREAVHFSRFVGKSLLHVTQNDVRDYLSYSKNECGNSDVTLNNKRRYLSSLFGWMMDEELIGRNPISNVKAVRCEKRKKKPFTETDLEKIRNACTNDRDRAIIELLDSSGMRVGELVGLKVLDVDIDARECTVFGKGRKERTCYMSDVAAMYIKRYLDGRGIDSEYLFAPLIKTNGERKMTVSSVECMVRKIGERAGVEKCHPHRFRRTMATRNLNRGMPIEEVKELLGHEELDTTLIYASSSKELVKTNARRLMG